MADGGDVSRGPSSVAQAVGPQRAEAGHAPHPPAAAAFPIAPRRFRGRDRRTLRKAVGGESAWMEQSLEGRRHPADQLIPDGGTARNPAVVHCAPGKRNSDTRGDTLLSGRFVGSNFPVQTGIYKLLCIDYIYPDSLSPPRPAARVPPAATAPPRPGLGVASGSSYTSRGKCQ